MKPLAYTSMDQSMDIYSPIWSGNSTPVNSDNDQDSIQSDEERETMCNNE
ncbi:hypothetical protein A3Q56_06949 [Intoshia linei]|uniref:Uncharacterized protein n=1 Tax=Intoshia linei TaxID=1819745 RepID=A0A177ATJ1_9BILA|nr:hypothetical protein A3Q56_06949 [Intoshia linei]